jgi:hypothetical protein
LIVAANTSPVPRPVLTTGVAVETIFGADVDGGVTDGGFEGGTDTLVPGVTHAGS